MAKCECLRCGTTAIGVVPGEGCVSPVCKRNGGIFVLRKALLTHRENVREGSGGTAVRASSFHVINGKVQQPKIWG